MNKFFFVFFFSVLLNTQPLFSQGNNLNITIGSFFNSKNAYGFYNNLRYQNKSNINFNLEYLKKELSTRISLNFDDSDKFNLDSSYINYEIGLANFNIGKIDRIWSFSDKSSLILSSNSRPLEAISIKLEDKYNNHWFLSNTEWSVEAIYGYTKNSYNGKNSMLFGARAVIKPSDQLSFEILQTSQWGGENNKLNKSTAAGIFLGETNLGENAEINKMAGFGASYKIPLSKNTYRIYGQAIGEDEAGNLPSCYSWIAGMELHSPNIRVPTMLAIELIETRADTSANGWCGPNIVYNNNTYDYINYNTVMGVPIDTEGTSLELFGQSQINKKYSINYSTKFLTINDKNYSDHRLSSKRSLGTITSLGINLKQDGFSLGGNISYQNMILDKANISNGIIFSLYTSVEF
jgi:hypothetical protein